MEIDKILIKKDFRDYLEVGSLGTREELIWYFWFVSSGFHVDKLFYKRNMIDYDNHELEFFFFLELGNVKDLP